MLVTMTAQISPVRLTFDAASNLKDLLTICDADAEFDSDLSGRLTVTVDDRHMYETLRILGEKGAFLIDVRADGLRSFNEYFGTKLPLDTERASVYCTMCLEGRI